MEKLWDIPVKLIPVQYITLLVKTKKPPVDAADPASVRDGLCRLHLKPAPRQHVGGPRAHKPLARYR